MCARVMSSMRSAPSAFPNWMRMSIANEAAFPYRPYERSWSNSVRCICQKGDVRCRTAGKRTVQPRIVGDFDRPFVRFKPRSAVETQSPRMVKSARMYEHARRCVRPGDLKSAAEKETARTFSDNIRRQTYECD